MKTRRTLRHLLLSLSALAALCGPGLAAAPGDTPPPGVLAQAEGPFGAYLAGHDAMAQGRVDDAATYLLQVVDDDPEDEATTLQAFLACLLAGRKEAAELARNLPDTPVAALLLADDDIVAGRWGAAEKRFAALPDQAALQPLQPLLVAWARFGKGDAAGAIDMLRPLTGPSRAGQGGNIYALHAALIADLGGRPADAARYYRIAAAGGRPNLREAQVLASWQARSGQEARARKTLAALAAGGGGGVGMALPVLMQDMTALPVTDARQGIAEAYLAMGAVLEQQGVNDLGLLLLRYAVDLRPDLTAARLLLSAAEERFSQPWEALAVLERVPLNDPLAPLVRLRRAALESRMGMGTQAEADMEALAAAFPADAEPSAELGDLRRAHGDFAGAVRAYDRAVKVQAEAGLDDWNLLYARATAYDREGQWKQAEADLEHVLRLVPDEPEALNYLGYSLAERGEQLDRARTMIEKAVAQRPQDGNILDSLGWVLLRAGDAHRAVAELEHATERRPADPVINGHLGDAYWADGRHREAEYQWRRALALNPEPAEAEKLQARLRGDGPVPHVRQESPLPASRQGAGRNVPAATRAD